MMMPEEMLSTEDYELCSKLKNMRFSGMAEALEDLLKDPNSDLLPFREKVGVWWMRSGISGTTKSSTAS